MTAEAEAHPVEKKVTRERKPKASEEKQPKAPKEKKPKAPKTAAHPPYFEMIKEALLALDEKSGSSPHAIAKYMEDKHKAVLPANFKKILAVQLKNSTARGKLIKVKASYKLAGGGKKGRAATKEKVPIIIMEKKTRSATASRKKTEAAAVKPARKVATKKAKMSTTAKPKQPRSIRSQARKAKKAAA